MIAERDRQGTEQQEPPKAGFVVILGRPNVGKSTFLNGVLGQKLSIVNPKPQTTRHRVVGILTRPEGQIAFLDTPGFLTPKDRLQEAMRVTVEKSLKGADLIMVMGDATTAARGVDLVDSEILEMVKGSGLPSLFVVNKIDALQPAELARLSHANVELPSFLEIHWTSALLGDGVETICQRLFHWLPGSPPYYPGDQISDQPLRFFAAELIRETIYEQFREEVPYSTAVVVEEFREDREVGQARKVYIRAEILVERESQKGIIIGQGGRTLRSVGAVAREKIERLIGRPVFLDLWVKVNKDWRKDRREVRRLGYVS
ncbi:MAG: GTPase Era [Dehalococcoidia bacterium]